MAENIKQGHGMLVQMSQLDFGYDLVAWHQHLKDTNIGGYNFGKRARRQDSGRHSNHAQRSRLATMCRRVRI